MPVLKRGPLASGKEWMIISTRQAALGPEEGEHYILLIPRDPANPSGDGLRRDELSAEDQAVMFREADSYAAEEAKRLNNAGYYRIEVNGPAAASRNHLHFHIIVGKPGTKFRRCVDRIIIC